MVASIFSDTPETKNCIKTCSSHTFVELITRLYESTMEDDEECNDDNYVPGGVEGDVDYAIT